ncbi:unnamed protein product [Somion occarium]|uniref:Cation efflux protein transmembrane domain-containing protein n=2 Tax=Somion occarium TaxID=3059160 RepID=A0ABP1DHT2_9APHY
MTAVLTRRMKSSQAKGKEPEKASVTSNHDHHEHDEHGREQHPGHSHSHSLFGLGHKHEPGEDGHVQNPEQIVEALKGGGDRGSRITVIGLVSNVGLTAAKGAAGWYMNSASLLADAGHSLGERYPYGFGKFEVIGTTTVSLLLTGGAIAFGLHSFGLLMEALTHTAAELPAGPVHDLLVNVTQIGHSVPAVASQHAHGHALDPNAAWFAAISIVAKEWLYRATKKVADQERSPVLFANAIHHRSDAYSSMVALVAILGTWYFPHLPLDPLGGLLVSFLIIQQGWGLTLTALQQLTDAGVSAKTRESLYRTLQPLLPSSPHADTPSSGQREWHTENLLAVKDLRAMRAGALMFVDLVAEVPNTLTVEQTSALEEQIVRALKKERKEISEVRIKFMPVPRDPLV